MTYIGNIFYDAGWIAFTVVTAWMYRYSWIETGGVS